MMNSFLCYMILFKSVDQNIISDTISGGDELCIIYIAFILFGILFFFKYKYNYPFTRYIVVRLGKDTRTFTYSGLIIEHL